MAGFCLAALLLAGWVFAMPAMAQSGGAAETTSTALAPAPEDEDWDENGGPKEVSDPLAFVNRPIAAINRIFRKGLLDPLAQAYQFITPDAAELALRNVAANLSEPFNVLGALVAGDGEGAATATTRFLINTSLGAGGLADVATEAGIRYCKEDIGQGLAKRGVEPGVHVVAPVLGPSNLRDLPGDLVEVLINPLPPGLSVAKSVIEHADRKDKINKLTESSLDAYVTERDAYEQHRLYEVSITCKLPDAAATETAEKN